MSATKSILLACKVLFLLVIFQEGNAHILIHLNGRLGNQLFQVATALALAKENQCGVYFPDFDSLDAPTEDYGKNQLKENYNYIFKRVPQLKEPIEVNYFYQEPDYAYHPIPYKENIEIQGFFISEKFFMDHKTMLINLFSPSKEIEAYLNDKFFEIIQHPQTVGIHVRTGYLEYQLNQFNPQLYNTYLPPDLDYFKLAIEAFDPDALFVVFSDHINWCKENFSRINRNFVFIENQEYIHDFYLLSKCKHAIIANSSFSWWAAYLNTNPNKKVICRMPFWAYHESSNKDIVCSDWIIIPMDKKPPIPLF